MSKQKIYLVIGVLLALSLVLVSVAAAVPAEKNPQKPRLLYPTKTLSYSSLPDVVVFDWTDVRNIDYYLVAVWRSEPGEENWSPVYDTNEMGTTTESYYEFNKANFPPGYDYRWNVVAFRGALFTYSRDSTFSVVE